MVNFKIYNYIKNIRRLFDIVNTRKYLKFYNKNKLPIVNKSKFFKDCSYKKTKKTPNRFIKNSNTYVFNSIEKIKNINKIFFLKKPIRGVSFFKLSLISVKLDLKEEPNLKEFNNVFFKTDNLFYYNSINNLITLRI